MSGCVVGLSRNRRRYKTISGTRSRAQDEKIDLDFLKNWGKSGNDSVSNRAIPHPAAADHGESKVKLDAKRPEQGSESAAGAKPEPAEAHRQTGGAKGTSLSSSAAKGPAQSPAGKTSSSEKRTKPAKPPKPTKLPKPVERTTQTPQAVVAHPGSSEPAAVMSGAEIGEASSQPQVVKKRLSLFSSLLRPSSPKKGEKATGPTKVKRPSSAKEKHSRSASPQKKASALPVSKQGKGSPGRKPVAQKADEGSRQAPTSNSESKVHPHRHEHSSPSEGVTRSQSMVNVSINSVVSFYEQRISQLQPSAGTAVTEKKTPFSNLQQSHAARRRGHRGREEIDSGLYSRAYHSMMDLSVAAVSPPPQPTAQSNEAPPTAPHTPPPPLPAGDGSFPSAQEEPRPTVQQRKKPSGRRPVTWALDDITETMGEIQPSPLTPEGDR